MKQFITDRHRMSVPFLLQREENDILCEKQVPTDPASCCGSSELD